MVKFLLLDYGLAFGTAALMRERIVNKEDSLIDVEGFFEDIDKKFTERSIKPGRWTHLHEFISVSMEVDIEYWIRKADPEEIAKEYIQPTLRLRSIGHLESVGDFADANSIDREDDELESLWVNSLREIFVEQVIPPLTNEVFTLLYSDRELLRQFNETIATNIKPLLKKDHPLLLNNDGKVYRCTYWPKWLRNALFYREKGHCPLCLSDISGVFSAGKDLAIDHIVPLNMGGTNDPTNLQILCDTCNGAKGGGPSKTASLQHVYWSIT